MSDETNVIDDIEYKNGQKNNWRRTAWNMIEDRVTDKNLPIVYLPGSKDLDAREALRRGFDSRNLIAVERSTKVVDYLRRRGRNTVKSDFVSALLNWPDNVPIGAIVADYQSCICPDAIFTVAAWLQMKALSKSVLLLNLQRGRESRNMWEGPKDYLSKLDHSRFKQIAGIPPNHRGFLAFLGSFQACCKLWKEKLVSAEDHFELGVHYAANTGLDWAFPPSYRSSPVSPFFDSIVLHRTREFEGMKDRHTLGGERQSGSIKRRIAAALAIRTMRFNGTLKVA